MERDVGWAKMDVSLGEDGILQGVGMGQGTHPGCFLIPSVHDVD